MATRQPGPRLDVAKYLSTFSFGQTITYGELSKLFPMAQNGWGPPLTKIAIWCSERRLPMLPVLVVKSGTNVPSPDADIYRQHGLRTEDALRAEQQRCWEKDWSSAFKE